MTTPPTKLTADDFKALPVETKAAIFDSIFAFIVKEMNPAPPAAAACDGWRAKCEVLESCDFPGMWVVCFETKSYAWLTPAGVWIDGLSRPARRDERHESRESALSALALADPPPNCMEPDAVAERQGIEDAKAGRGCVFEPHDPEKAWYYRGWNRQRAKMEAQPAKPDELAAKREAMVQRMRAFKAEIERLEAIIADKDKRIAELEAKPAQPEETEMVYVPVYDDKTLGEVRSRFEYELDRSVSDLWLRWPATVVKGEAK